MPGHKGHGRLARFDLTEIKGADDLYAPEGIIRQSEENASAGFGARTVYSTEGSSQSIRAMLYLAVKYAKGRGVREPLILAGRNAHKSFISAAALVGFDVEWLTGEYSYLTVSLDAKMLRERLSKMQRRPDALYVTSPDYLGFTADIRGLSEVCRSEGILLLCDNAHGAYLKLTEPSLHPIDLGADICCDSAHKTLPALTGCGYLHFSKNAPAQLYEGAKAAMALFGSSSPSYLLLCSLDECNFCFEEEYKLTLRAFLEELRVYREAINALGFPTVGDEPMKITLDAKAGGYRGDELYGLLYEREIVAEFADPDYIVFMPTPATGTEGLIRLLRALKDIGARAPIMSKPPRLTLPCPALSPREALLLPSELVAARESLGRIAAEVTVGCPPAVPIVCSGEVIDENAVEAFKYYGIESLWVVKK